ncbi:MAG: hypothetical protein IVW57_01075 [Ktedonobacterales bacterium]|nr:hypothetical protein [Ktedonobacterales bacterium]
MTHQVNARRLPHTRATPWSYRPHVVLAALILGVLLVLAGRGATTQTGHTSPTPSPSPGAPSPTVSLIQVEFASNNIGDEVRLITDLGFQPSFPCNGTKVTSGYWVRWQATGLSFGPGGIQAEPTPLIPRDWLARLDASPLVRTVFLNPRAGCARYDVPSGTSGPNDLAFLAPSQAGTYARMTFDSSVPDYYQAIYTAVDLGMRLANPCYEHMTGTPPPWRPVGQESQFAASHELVVATTDNASNHWQRQLAATQGIRKVETPYAPTC